MFTNGQQSGTATYTLSASGSYVARAFSNNTYTLLGESAAFSVGVDLTVDKPNYAVGATVTVSYGGLPGNAQDWIAIAPGMVAGDFNGDGKPDLALQGDRVSEAGARIVLNDGTGHFGTPFIVGPARPGAFGAADFNGDGGPDLVNGAYRVLLNATR